MTVSLLYSPFPSIDAARVASRALVERKLVACCNLLPASEAHYLWQGEYTVGQEVILLAKTTPAALTEARAALQALHPYECPAILSFEASAAPDFVAWVGAACTENNKVNEQD